MGKNTPKTENRKDEFESELTISQGSFSANSCSFNNGSAKRYKIFDSGRELSYADVLDLWEENIEFLDFILRLFKDSGFNSYVWETLPITSSTVQRKFEFVIISKPESSTNPDLETYKEYFDTAGPNNGVVTFPNLGYDAHLIVPSPLKEDVNYSGMAEFFSHAPRPQQYALWNVLAREIKLKLSEKNMWVSVAGGGISWLHIRLDEKPKYYSFMPYTEVS